MSQSEQSDPRRDRFERDPAVPRNDQPPARYPSRGSDDDADWTPPKPPDLLGRGAVASSTPPRDAAPPPMPPPPAPPRPPPALRGLSPVNESEVRGITATQPHRGVLLLVLGIVGLLVCQLLCPVTWILANGDLAEIRSGRMDPEGRNLTQAGLVLGIVGTVLLLGPLLLLVFFALLAGGLSGI